MYDSNPSPKPTPTLILILTLALTLTLTLTLTRPLGDGGQGARRAALPVTDDLPPHPLGGPRVRL